MSKKMFKEDARRLLRDIESTVEIVALTIIYYVVWRHGYDDGIFPYYHYNGKYVLMGIYALMTFILFSSLDCFKFGKLKSLDITLGQVIAILGTNILTYFQLCLIANRMVTPLPMVILTVIQMIVATALINMFSAVYHKIFAPRNMLLVYGSANAIGI